MCGVSRSGKKPNAENTEHAHHKSPLVEAERAGLEAYRQALLQADWVLPSAVRLADDALLCNPDALADLADIEQTQARVLLFSFEEAGLVQRGTDCTLEATILLNKAPDEILASLEDATERRIASTLFGAIGAALDKQAKPANPPAPR